MHDPNEGTEEGAPTDPTVPTSAGLLGPLADWVGTWRGSGRGAFPTIEGFDYHEEVVFGATGKPVLSYRQRTTGVDGHPLHAETGWIRLVASSPDPDGPAPAGVVAVEWAIAQPTGLLEAATGTLDRGTLDVTATPHGTPSAVEVTDVRRRFRLVGDELAYDLWMATAAVPTRTHHLAASLRRVTD